VQGGPGQPQSVRRWTLDQTNEIVDANVDVLKWCSRGGTRVSGQSQGLLVEGSLVCRRVAMLLQAVRRQGGTITQGCICKICHGFGARAEVRCGLLPSHGKHQRQACEGLSFEGQGESDCKGQRRLPVELHPTATIGQITFSHEDRAQSRIGREDALNEAHQNFAKLHGFAGSRRLSVEVDVEESVVAD